MTPDEKTTERARRGLPRRAFSLLELVTVVAIVGLISAMAMMRFGHATLNTTDTEGFARRLTLDMRQARRAVISTGEDHYVRFNRTGGVVIGYDLMRNIGQDFDITNDISVQPATLLPADTTVEILNGTPPTIPTTGADIWRFNFKTGELSTDDGSTTVEIVGGDYKWTLTGYLATGIVRVAKTQP